jgi:hypothetical protein
MVASFNRILLLATATLALAAACFACCPGAASAQSTPKLANAVEVGIGAKGIAAVCARQAKRKVLRASASSAAARVQSVPGKRAVTARMKRRAKALRRHCLARLRHRPTASPQSVPMPEVGPLVVGIDGGYGSWSKTETEERAALGAAVTRHEWDPSEAVDAQDDVVLSAATEVHTRIHALLGGNNLGNPTHYREWVVAFIRRYGLGGSFWKEHPELDEARYAIQTFELGNEPYFGSMSAGEYADAVRPALEEVHDLGLPAKMVLISRVYGTDTSWMDTLYSHIPNLNSLFYAFADHPYWYGHDPAESSPAGPFDRIETLRQRMNEQGAGSKPIFITEYGESTASCGGECVSEQTQAEHLGEMIDAIATHPQWGVEMLSVYQLRDRGSGSGEREREFGLLREDGTEKPSYSLVRAAMQQYRG